MDTLGDIDPEDIFSELDLSSEGETDFSDMRIYGGGDIVVSGSGNEWVVSRYPLPDSRGPGFGDDPSVHSTEKSDVVTGDDKDIYDLIWYDPYNKDYEDFKEEVEEKSVTTFKGISLKYDEDFEVVPEDRRMEFIGEIDDGDEHDRGTLWIKPYHYEQKGKSLGGVPLVKEEPENEEYDLEFFGLEAGDGIEITPAGNVIKIKSTGGGGGGGSHPFKVSRIETVNPDDPDAPFVEYVFTGGYVYGYRNSSDPFWVPGFTTSTSLSKAYINVATGADSEVISAGWGLGSLPTYSESYTEGGGSYVVPVADVVGDEVRQSLGTDIYVHEEKPSNFRLVGSGSQIVDVDFYSAMNGWNNQEAYWSLEFTVQNNIVGEFSSGTYREPLYDLTGGAQSLLRVPVARGSNIFNLGSVHRIEIIAVDGAPVTQTTQI